MSITSKHTGSTGESIAVTYLTSKGFAILSQNYTKKWGEIDVIVKKDGVVHFVEVKTVSYETKQSLNWAVTHETWRPEELVHAHKLHQLEKMIATWLYENTHSGSWQIDVIAVRIVPRETFACVNYLENIS